ncbi:MAG: STAS domain-containing protein [Calditrichota bacterium]
MEFKVVQDDDVVYITIIGAVDNDNAEDLKQEFSALLAMDFEEAVFDLTYVPFITSSGIGKFLIFYKNTVAARRRMSVKGINDNLLELFRSIKLDQLFQIDT